MTDTTTERNERPQPSLSPDERLSYTLAEACRVTGLSDDTIRRKHHRGEITLKKSGRSTIVDKEDVVKMLANLPALPRRAA
jgi:excisionase family DNA binding protein